MPGFFTRSVQTLPLAAVWGDLDADGDVDALIKQEGAGYSAHMNDGQGSFSQEWQLEDSTAMRVGDMTLGDVDADGDLDAIITNGHYPDHKLSGPGLHQRWDRAVFRQRAAVERSHECRARAGRSGWRRRS